MIVDLLKQGDPLLIGDLDLPCARGEWILSRGVEVVVDWRCNNAPDSLVNKAKWLRILAAFTWVLAMRTHTLEEDLPSSTVLSFLNQSSSRKLKLSSSILSSGTHLR